MAGLGAFGTRTPIARRELTIHEPMSLTSTIQDEQRELDAALRAQVGICVDTYRAIRTALRVIGVLVVAWVMVNPALAPRPTLVLVFAALVLGPDIVETYLTR